VFLEQLEDYEVVTGENLMKSFSNYISLHTTDPSYRYWERTQIKREKIGGKYQADNPIGRFHTKKLFMAGVALTGLNVGGKKRPR
jgi:hypothetical protein